MREIDEDEGGHGYRPDLLEAALTNNPAPTLAAAARRAGVLEDFLGGENGAGLLAAFRRAGELMEAERVAYGRYFTGKPRRELYQSKEERELAVALTLARNEAEAALARDDYAQAAHAISTLRPFVDNFFVKLATPTDMVDLLENRLKLLNEFRETMRLVAQFEKVAA